MKTQTTAQKIILGSSSIYRKELLQRLQIPFETVSPEINEMPLDNESPEETATRLAEAKAREVARIFPQALIIGSDQVAVLEDTRLGKPLNHGNATEQLRLMRGKEVIFYTALCLLNSSTDRLQMRVIPFFVKFRKLSDQQIENYLLKEQPYHCAGSAKSEGLGIALIERMTGDDPNALIGLPLISLIDMLAHEGVAVI
ncbi:MAG: septum formation inhibitor Maf [Nitrosomonas sp.]|nr:septum formation inhibitor Maf [Nitrosomonas sp.]MBP7113650.1 septum formation inhibitor Maf [Nitrosomonas sp.]